MDYERKYKEALDWMQSLYDGLHGATKEDAEHYFPELKESEDERIRKGLIKAVSGILKGNTLYGTDVTREEAIAWLEKQGEFDDNIITRDDEILQAISVGLTDVVEDAGWSPLPMIVNQDEDFYVDGDFTS